MARQGYLSLEGGQDVVNVVVACAAISDAEIEKVRAAAKQQKDGKVVWIVVVHK